LPAIVGASHRAPLERTNFVSIPRYKHLAALRPGSAKAARHYTWTFIALTLKNVARIIRLFQ